MRISGGKWFGISAIGVPLALIGGGIVIAQIEGPKRGINPIASNGDFEVTNIAVNVTADNAQAAFMFAANFTFFAKQLGLR